MGAHCHLPVSPLPPVVASLEGKPPGAPSGTKKSGRELASKRGPGSVATRTVQEDNRIPPAPGTLVLTHVFPPRPILPSPPNSAGLRSGGKGPAGKKGHLTESPQRGRSSPRTPKQL